jgi:hypothetical protein
MIPFILKLVNLTNLRQERLRCTIGGKLKSYKKTDFDVIINDADTVITNNQQDITSLETMEDELQEQRNDLQNEIVDLIQNMKAISYHQY